jgi:hypothetical protein
VYLPQSEPDEDDTAGGDWNTDNKHHHLLEMEEQEQARQTQEEQEQALFDAHGHYFSNVISTVTLCSKYTRALTFEKWWQVQKTMDCRTLTLTARQTGTWN